MIKKLTALILAALLAAAVCGFTAYAESAVLTDGKESIYSNEAGVNRAVISDGAGLFTSAQISSLAKELEGVLPYGGAAVVTVQSHPYSSTDSLAEAVYRSLFGNGSGAVFVIDMALRNIYIFTDGDIHKTIGSRKAAEITDNTYRYATKGDYYACVSQSFRQITALLEGRRIFTPMKYIACAFISFGVAMMVCIGIVITQRKLPKLSKDINGKEVDGIKADLPLTVNTRIVEDKVTVNSSGGGSGGRGGFGGGGGGGHSGGGGGHGF